MVTTSGLTDITIYLRQSGNPSNSTTVQIYSSTDGNDFSTATSLSSTSTQTITEDTVTTYTFTGLTINQYDSLFIRTTPTSGGSLYYGVIIVS